MRTRRYMHGRKRRKSPFTFQSEDEVDVDSTAENAPEHERAQARNNNAARQEAFEEGKEKIQKVQIVNKDDITDRQSKGGGRGALRGAPIGGMARLFGGLSVTPRNREDAGPGWLSRMFG